jgi:hypothetical protein
MFTNKCNASCKWCIEKNGWHPSERIAAAKLAAKAVSLNPEQVNILGGEPTQEYDELDMFVRQLQRFSKAKISITSNGSNLPALLGMYADYYNLSIHHYDMSEDARIKGWTTPNPVLTPLGLTLWLRRVRPENVRFNCTVHKAGIHTRAGINRYLQWAVDLGVTNIRFAELRCCTKDEGYISLRDLLGDSVPADPFTEGCCTTIEEAGITIQYRTSCGIVCPAKSLPGGGEYSQPGGTLGVLYYDGSHFPTWQKAGGNMNQLELLALLEGVRDGDVKVAAALKIIAPALGGPKHTPVPLNEAEVLKAAANCHPRRRAEESCHGSGCHGRRGGC